MQGVVRSYSKPDPHEGKRFWNLSNLKTIQVINILLNAYENDPSFNTFKQSRRSLCKKNSFAKKKKQPSIYLIIKVQIYARATTKMECRDVTVRVEGYRNGVKQ